MWNGKSSSSSPVGSVQQSCFSKESKKCCGDGNSTALVHSTTLPPVPSTRSSVKQSKHFSEGITLEKCRKLYQMTLCSRLLTKPFWFSALPIYIRAFCRLFSSYEITEILIVLKDVVKEVPKEYSGLIYKAAQEPCGSWDKTASYSLQFNQTSF